ncbi:MAG: hypothetical protein U9Q21_00570, partial [Candidatus Auribacterota bacterium]|nr:hypothetical protein [Candidatus Auribacterota bacterium]
LNNGEMIELKNAPTYFGEISFKVESFIDDGFIKLTFDNKTIPETGYLFCSPLKKKITRVVIDGMPGKKVPEGKIPIPPQAKEVFIYY